MIIRETVSLIIITPLDKKVRIPLNIFSIIDGYQKNGGPMKLDYRWKICFGGELLLCHGNVQSRKIIKRVDVLMTGIKQLTAISYFENYRLLFFYPFSNYELQVENMVLEESFVLLCQENVQSTEIIKKFDIFTAGINS